MTKIQKIKSSFRDPGNTVFMRDGDVYRHIHATATAGYNALMGSGLYRALIAENLLVPHDDVTSAFAGDVASGDIVIKPARVPFISYPFEWSFTALKAAALATLRIQKLCLDHGMTLQDATAYNIQFLNGAWLLIDTGSFQPQDHGAPWVAYRQFCQHFLAPLLVMSYCDVRLVALLSKYLDGMPLDLAAKMLPFRAKCRPAVWLHIVLHSRYAGRDFDVKTTEQRKVSKASLYGLIDQLSSLISSLEVEQKKTVWTSYEDDHTYTTDEYKQKEKFIQRAKKTVNPASAWDLGANTGHFSRLMADVNTNVIAFEYDAMTVEAGCRKSKAVTHAPLHLWMDLFNPTPGAGWAGDEWRSLKDRGPADLVLALALVHHLCLTGNITFPQLFDFFKDIARHMVVEFVPKDDPQAQRLLKTKKDIFPHYTQEAFEAELNNYFSVLESEQISHSGRRVYLLKCRTA